MVGTGSGRSPEGTALQVNAVFKLNYPNSSTISTSIVAGVLESVDDVSSANYFDPIRVLAYVQKDYEFTRVSDALDSCAKLKVEGELLGFEYNRTCAHLSTLTVQKFRLGYGGSCSGHYCGPFDRARFYQSFMGFNQVQCSENGRLRLYIVFTDREHFGFSKIMLPEKSLVAEGIWDHEKKRLCLVACRVLNFSSSLAEETVGDCTIRLSLWFPSVLSIENMSMASGWIWSTLDRSDSKYFDKVSIGVVENRMISAPGAKYNYTQMDRVKRFCIRNYDRKMGERVYPDTRYIGDMRFGMSLTNAEGKSAWGYANPLFINQNLYNRFPPFGMSVPSLAELNQSSISNVSFWNVSYKMGYTFSNASVYASEATELSSEGTYDARTGKLCMVGCLRGNLSLDCEVLINVQFPSLDPKVGEHLTGTIKSLRKQSDPLFFKPLEISSYGIYHGQAAETIWWMDMEIMMVLISLTFSCVFIGLQLFHIKKNPDVLPSISITMLAILTLGHMIPLVLNFEALFSRNRNQQNVLLRSGGWLQVNEVLVRLITMVAFLLQFYLLRVAMSSRSADEGKKGLWVAEKKTLLCCLPLYAVGGLIALLVHLRSSGTQQKRLYFLDSHHHSLWEDLMSYAGFILDNFLLPQFILNIFWNSKDKSLAPSFYAGMTIVRAFPHLYDAYRAGHYVPHLNSSYIYASRDGDFYSSAWDIIIPFEGGLLVVLIYLQQQFGGASLLPRRIKESGGYQMVPVANH